METVSGWGLDQFSLAELQTLLDVVVAKIVEEDEHKKEWCRVFAFDPKDVSSLEEMYYDEFQRPLRSTNYEHLCLWRTQILNSIVEVKLREQVNSN